MIRIGIVGCGRILAAHLRGYQLLREAGYDDFQITALCARRIEDAESYVRRGSGPAQRPPVGTAPGDPLAVGDIYLSDFQPEVPVALYDDYQQMIADGPIDAVNDFTTHAMHHPVGLAALSRDKHLLTQKPLAGTLDEARALCGLAAQRQRVFGVFENARFRPDTRYLGWLFNQSTRCGQLRMVYFVNVGNWWAPDRIVAHTPWRHRREEGGGIALDIGVHLFHHLRYVAGEIAQVSGWTSLQETQRTTRDPAGAVTAEIACDAEDTLITTFETSRGVLGSLAASWAGHGRGLKTGSGRGMCYYGTAGCVIDEVVTTDSGETVPLESLYRAECPMETQQRHFPRGLTSDFALNQHDWLEAIRSGGKPEASGEEGLRDLLATHAVLESHRCQRRIRVADL